MSRKFPDLYSTKRSFISPASFHIFNRLCDTLVLLVIAYGRHYPDQPFCPWLLGTEFVEHFFGLARMILPNFTYAELLKMIQNVMVRQRILLTGNFKENRERNSASGYILDYDMSPLSQKERCLAVVNLEELNINSLVELAFKEASSICRDVLGLPVPAVGPDNPLRLVRVGAPQRKSYNKTTGSCTSSDEEDVLSGSASDSEAEGDGAEVDLGALTASAAHITARYSALCDDFETGISEFSNGTAVFGPPPPSLPSSHAVPSSVSSSTDQHRNTVIHSDLLASDNKVTISRMLDARRKLQSQTSTHSERTLALDKKFALQKVIDETGKIPKMTTQEGSQRVRIAQIRAGVLEKEKKYRELRWKTASKSLRDVLIPQGMFNL
jgi:hypothetical protein